ncbi:hypothetical protein [Methylobacterium iners]|uniref:Uncharacterized protein n=1 Tax=Methylobacterium iners TaxID=418707 RepID=A0ABQ4S515_9HYPH|nr:hypothetical protein [Methylobacterium iners]GJD96974.1 hypothetical protein OCOJLMKI_4202 [Methylobacterium iners]
MASFIDDPRALEVDPFEAVIPDPAAYARWAELLHQIDDGFIGRDLAAGEEAPWLAHRQPVLEELRRTIFWPSPNASFGHVPG